jgi:hypothetical protein
MKTLDKLSIDQTMDLSHSFNAMVEYFRAFEATAAALVGRYLSRPLRHSQAGVCRHARSS